MKTLKIQDFIGNKARIFFDFFVVARPHTIAKSRCGEKTGGKGEGAQGHALNVPSKKGIKSLKKINTHFSLKGLKISQIQA